jgi:ubiquinone/menaquinone biosynthesis C-methylase UbiE
VTSAIVAAYSATGGAWARGPERVYRRLAAAMTDHAPVALDGRTVVDVGAGTGAAGAAAIAAGAAAVVAVDAAVGMLRHERGARVPAVAADALSLPFGDGTFDGALAGFSLNHVSKPALGLREMARVVRAGGPVLASAYASDDAHPVKQVVAESLASIGGELPPWYAELQREIIPQLATLAGCRSAVDDAGLDAEVLAIHVALPELEPADLVEWRLGMAQHAPFVRSLTEQARADVVADAVRRLGASPPTLVRSVLIIAGVKR